MIAKLHGGGVSSQAGALARRARAPALRPRAGRCPKFNLVLLAQRRFALALTLTATLGLAAGGCGSDDDGGGARDSAPAATTPTARAPDATTPPPDATQPDSAPPPSSPRTGAERAPDAGDTGGAAPPAADDEEQSVRVPATFAVLPGGRLDPSEITVPPLLAVEVTVSSGDGKAHRVELATPEPQTLAVPAGGRATIRLGGLRAGRYEVRVDGRSAGAIVAGGEVGP